MKICQTLWPITPCLSRSLKVIGTNTDWSATYDKYTENWSAIVFTMFCSRWCYCTLKLHHVMQTRHLKTIITSFNQNGTQQTAYLHQGHWCREIVTVKLEITCINPHQTGFLGKGSDDLQLIKFWPSRAPGKGFVAGRKFLTPPYYSQRAVFASLWVLFSFLL